MKTIFDYFPIKETEVDILDQPLPNKGIVHSLQHEVVIKKLTQVMRDYPVNLIKGFTLTFNDKKLWKKYRLRVVDPVLLHRTVANTLFRSTIWKKSKYFAFPEFDKNGRLHYHGIIYGEEWDVNAIRQINVWRRAFGFAKAELRLRSVKNWFNYIVKDYKKTGLWTLYRE